MGGWCGIIMLLNLFEVECFERSYGVEYVRIRNQFQAKAYLSDGVKPVDVYYDEKIDKIIFVFKKEDTKEVWEKWKHFRYQGLYLKCANRIFTEGIY